MERITYRKTLDVQKNGVQFLLQGFETADKMSRVIEVSFMASGDAIDFPLERVVAMMYVTSPGATEPSINKCTIVDNKVVYEVLPITTEGITEMQIKLIETSPEGAKSVLASAKFAVEVTESGMNDDGEELKTTFTALEDAVSKAKATYDERFLRMELTSDCIFKAYYADGSIYETDVIRRLLLENSTDLDLDALVKNGLTSFSAEEVADVVEEVLDKKYLQIFDNLDKKYYSLYAKSKCSDDLLGDYPEATFVQWDADSKHTPYTDGLTELTEGFAFVVGNVSDNHTIIAWAIGGNKMFPFVHYVTDGADCGWVDTKVDLAEDVKEVLPVKNGGTGKTTLKGVKELLAIDKIAPMSSYLTFVGNINEDMVEAAFGKNNEDEIVGVGKALAMYAKYKGETANVDYLNDYDKYSDIIPSHKGDLANTPKIFDLIKSSPYAYEKLTNTNTGLPDIVLYDKGNTEYLDIPNATIYNFVKDEDEHYDGKIFAYSLDTNSNISITKNVSNTEDLTKAFQYTMPLLKDLPKLSGYRYLNVKLSDDEESYTDRGRAGFRVILGGIETSMYQHDGMVGWIEPSILLTGSLYKKDLFDNYASNPNSQEVAISIYLKSWSKQVDDFWNRSANLTIHIDKIWISES